MAAPKAPAKKKGSMPPWMQGDMGAPMPAKPMPAKKKAPAKKGR